MGVRRKMMDAPNIAWLVPFRLELVDGKAIKRF
jgi:hypothetical protein